MEDNKKSQIISCWIFPENFQPEYSCDTPHQKDCEAPPTLRKLGLERVIGRKIEWASCHIGTYGMGGSGFLGLKLEKTDKYPAEFLVLTLWGADTWVHFNDDIIDNNFNQEIYQVGYKEFEKAVENCQILAFGVWDKNCKMVLSNGSILEVKLDPNTRPRYAGGDKGLRAFAESDSLWDAWVFTERQLLV